MLGGVGDGDAFFSSSSDELRPLFVRQPPGAAGLIGFDGVDIDWEENLEQPETRRRLLALVHALRRTRPGIILTFPAPWLRSTEPAPDPFFARLAASVDQFNVMSYGMTGGWQGWDSWFFLGARRPRRQLPDLVSYVANAYAALGIPRNKIGIGIGYTGPTIAPGPPGSRASPTAPARKSPRPPCLRVYRCTRSGVSSNAEGTHGFRRGRRGRHGALALRRGDGPRQSLRTSRGVQGDDNEWRYNVIATRVPGSWRAALGFRGQ